MLEYGFFQSINGDRKYNADSINKNLNGFISETGVFKKVGLSLKVLGGIGGMRVAVGTGRARLKNHFANNITQQILVLERSDITLNRYDAIALSLNQKDRLVEFRIIKGTSATEPERPAPQRDTERYDIILAYIHVAAGITEITENEIIDTRDNTAICGYVKLLVDGVAAGLKKYVTYFESKETDRYDLTTMEVSGYSTEKIELGYDVIKVDINGIVLNEEEDYQLYRNDTGNIILEFKEALNSGNRVTLTIIKPILEVI
ncbi:MAG: hypothetical protein K2M46_10435 [Lachnospiraceae bacterium]|nr:hypothetical protein [Lachnospiraceae bacterium]